MGTGITAETQEIPVAAPEPAGDGKGALPMGSLTTFCLLEIPVLSQPLILAFFTWPDQRGILWDKNRTGAVSSFLETVKAKILCLRQEKAPRARIGCFGVLEVTGLPWLCV